MLGQIIIEFSFKCSFISSSFKIWTYKYIKEGDSLILLKEFALEKLHVQAHNGGDGKAYTAACRCSTYWKTYNQAKEEFIKTGKIKGFEALNLRTFEKVWISHYDMTNLTKL